MFFKKKVTEEVAHVINQWASRPNRSIALRKKGKGLIKSRYISVNAREDGEKRETSCTVGGNVNWNSHYGELYGNYFKN